MENNTLDKKKAHRDRHSGRKSEKKKIKKEKEKLNVEELTDKQRNPKAFAFNSAVRAERRYRRKQDIETKKQHIPLVDRTAVEPPPIIVVVVGPPKVGKSTVINNLTKMFTRMPLMDIKGPVTIVTGKKRRVTFIECNNDINSMIDLAKIADLVLLLCDASFGFEMEVFEFLNICQVHGMPRVMGILTHLDMIKNSKTLKNTKKTLKHRFWTEVYPGAKLFYLSGIIRGEYLRNEVKNLGRFISIMKFRPLQWRSTHSYILSDRYEDLTNQELIRKNPKCDRNISLYGYVRGVPLKKETSVHIAGMGDLKIYDISFLPDPCPLPEQLKKRALIEKEKLVYAPFSGVGGIVYDKDAVYVELGGSHSHKKREEDGELENMVSNLTEVKETLDEKMKYSGLQIFTGGEQLTDKDLDDKVSEINEIPLYEKKQKSTDDDLTDELKALRKTYEEINDSGRIRRKVLFNTSDDVVANYSENDSESDEQTDGSDDNNDESKKDKIEVLKYTSLSANKNKDIHFKINSVLSNLENKNTEYSTDKSYLVIKGNEEKMDDIQNSDDDTNNEESESEDEDINSNDKEKADYLKEMEDHDDLESENEQTKTNNIDNRNKNEHVDHTKEDSSEESSNDANDDMMHLKWKDNLAEKAQQSFLDRQSTNKNLMKLVYGVFDSKYSNTKQVSEEEDTDEENNIGGLFKKISTEQQKIKLKKNTMNLTESSLMLPWNASTKDWLESENKVLIMNCFVTGKWKDSEDATELLKLDDAQDLSDVDSEVFGDFEDLETGEKHVAKEVKETTKRKRDVVEKDEEADKEVLAEKKRKLKEKFNAEYDNTEKTSYYDDLKMSVEKQSQLNKTVFEDMPEDVRIQIEGYRPGMYVRIEVQNVPAEFVKHFDPTYPLVIGALNMGEENIGYVNVKLKKHRWYNKMLKANDPLIISLGWRRFQTIPLYSKLEDDLKHRYLKYTPEHIACNAHFWGPITPQGTGFLALQAVNNDQEMIKKLGFRIAATGSVQEMDKSTKIMKKLKLIGYPLKIYKKTAFIKGMFNSTLEVARFEGATIKTVSGIRGQIKKAVSKPEGCFRATFEDKIQLSDIVFCRTWYKVDVTKFYTPVNTLLLPPAEKNLWQGLRTVGEIKRERGIKNQVNTDHLYTHIEREVKPFKPLVIPQKLQKALPYRDKPRHGVKDADKKKKIDRVAVIREPYEQKVSTMMKMLRASYGNKQEKLKQATKERIEKHQQEITAIELKKNKKLKQQKKEVFRYRSKNQTRQEDKGGT